MRTAARKVFLLLALLAALACQALASMGAIVPAYFYPSGKGLNYWKAMNAAAARIPLIAIMNPNSGPGPAQDSNYVAAVQSLRAAGGRVIGYISTNYTSNTSQSVKADIDRYYSFYTLDGIFLDEMTNDDSLAHLNYYADLTNYIHAKAPGAVVFGSPGTNTVEAYFLYHCADALVIFESKASAFNGYQPSSWVRYYPANRLGDIIYSALNTATMILDIGKSAIQNIGWVFLTNDKLPNPYDTLPSYWTQEVDAIAIANALP